MEQCLGGGLLSLSLSLSLVARTFWHAFGLNLKGFFTHFVVIFSYFIVVLIHLFAYKRHFLGHCAFLKFLNALFLGFYALFVILSLLQKGDPTGCKAQAAAKKSTKIKRKLAIFLDTSLALSMAQRVFGVARQVSIINTTILSQAKKSCALLRNIDFIGTTSKNFFKRNLFLLFFFQLV